MITGLYRTEVQIEYGQLKEMVDWCASHCTGPWGYSVLDEAGEAPGIYRFQFDHEKDYVTFLVWRQ